MKINKATLATALRHAGMVRPDRVNIVPNGDGAIIINAAEKGHGGVATQSVVQTEADGDVGAFQAPYQHFRAVVESMPEGVLTIKAVDNDAVTVQNGRTRLKTRAIYNPAVDMLSTDGASANCKLNGAALRGAIGQTVHAIAQKSPMESLNTMRLEVSNGNAEAVATDGRRMMVSRFEAQHAGGDIAISVVDTAMPLISAMADEGDVSIHIVGKSVVLARGAWLCRVPVIAKYPNWRRILTQHINPTDPQFTVDAPQLLGAMRRMIIADEGEAGQARYGHPVRVSTEGDAMRIALVGNDSEDVVSIESGVDQVDLGTDARQIADLLAAVGAGKVRVIYVGNGDGGGRIVVVPDDHRDLLTSRFVSTLTEYRI